MNEQILKDAFDMKDWLRDIRRDFHCYPEGGYLEFRTSDKIRSYLKDMGADVTVYPSSTAIVGLIRGASPGKTIAIRADMDALPIMEENKVPYCSRNPGMMHACGHDAHMAIGLGAAKWFAMNKSRFSGNIKLLFQPAEETVGGALDMIKAGCMVDPDVDYVIGLHVASDMPAGTVGIRYGTTNGSSDTLEVTIHGSKAHGAYPEKGIDAIAIAAQVIAALHTITGRYVSPQDSAVLTIGTIAGGTASNIIADRVDMKATLRTTDEMTREKTKAVIKQMVAGIAGAMGGRGEVAIEKGYDPVVNDTGVVDILTLTAKALLGDGKVKTIEKTSLGVEDFGYFTAVCRGAFYRLGCGNADKGIVSPAHSGTFDIDEDCLPVGVAMHVATALKLLHG